MRWTWAAGGSKPMLRRVAHPSAGVLAAHHTDPLFQKSLDDYYLYAGSDATLLFTENESNNQRLFGTQNDSPYVKDAFHSYLIHGRTEAVNPAQTGTKSAAYLLLEVGAGEIRTMQLRLTTTAPSELPSPFTDFDRVFAKRLKEADEFYNTITPPKVLAEPDRAMVLRQALAGLLWTKQYFYYDLNTWLKEHNVGPYSPPELRSRHRNAEWFHMFNDDIISMPDKWEYPWCAAWDLAFHTLALATVDVDFAKTQLDLMLRDDYLHPNGQIPAYEWNFGDVNPPVHAYATIQIYLRDKERRDGTGDIDFLKYAFSKLLINYTWWLNRKHRFGKNVFEGGFLGLDNIAVFDRSAPLPTGGSLEQADGTAWMVFFSQQMLRIAVELAQYDPLYEDFVTKFFEHTIWISGAMDRVGDNADEMWDEEDGFFYDVLRLPDGNAFRLKVRSMVGLLPLAAVAIFEQNALENLPGFLYSAKVFLERHPQLAANIHMPAAAGLAGRRLLSTVNEEKLKRVLARMLDEQEFFGPYGIRALSRYHLEHPFVFEYGGSEYRVSYLPGDSDSGMFGGNSNWRGPVWMPVNFLLYIALLRLAAYYGDSFKVECPTGSGNQLTLLGVAHELAERLTATFLRDKSGRRPVFGGSDKFQNDPHWRDCLLLYEYFHGDNGAGIGASHQTGWTGTISQMIIANGVISDETVREANVEAYIARKAAELHK
jgi:hypothetical protein